MIQAAPSSKTRFPAGISLYIHVPFCHTKCPYCDFNTFQGIDDLKGPYVDAMVRELEMWGRLLDHPGITTIFFGGGTPSYMAVDQMEAVLKAVAQRFDVGPDAEITIESNPGDITPFFLDKMLSLGVNRISIGVQAFDDGFLKMLGRRHNSSQAKEAYLLARKAGFSNINLDLMYGLPQQTLDQWKDSVASSLELGPDHLSLYCLTLEEGTPLKRWVDQGHLPVPDPDLSADMYSYTRSTMEAAGYVHYEISNWAVPGHQCSHNLTYWENRPYLGVGPGGHSSLEGHRFWGVSSPRLYIERSQRWPSMTGKVDGTMDWKQLADTGPLADYETIGAKLEMAETMLLGLRLLEGLDADRFRLRFGQSPWDVYPDQVRDLTEAGLLEQCADRLRLTSSGLFLSNQVFMQFLD